MKVKKRKFAHHRTITSRINERFKQQKTAEADNRQSRRQDTTTANNKCWSGKDVCVICNVLTATSDCGVEDMSPTLTPTHLCF